MTTHSEAQETLMLPRISITLVANGPGDKNELTDHGKTFRALIAATG